MVLQRRKSPEDNAIEIKPVKLSKASRCERFEYELLEWKIENLTRLNLQFASHAGVYRCYNFSFN